MAISASEAVGPAFEHMKRQLLQPFRFGQWVRLAFVGLLAGELGSGGGGGFHFNVPVRNRGHRNEQLFPDHIPAWILEHPWQFVGVVIAAIVVVAIIGTALLYINSVMRFILFDSLITRECHIRAGWRRRKHEGFGLFVWQAAVSAIFLLATVLVIGIPVGGAWALGWFAHSREHILPLVLVGILLFLMLLFLAIVSAVVQVLTKDFVVPQIALEGIDPLEAWRRLLRMMRTEQTAYAGYIGMKVLLAIGAGIAMAIIGIAVLLMLLLPIAAFAIGTVLAAKAAGWTWTASTIGLAVVVGLILLAALTFLVSLVNVPTVVFFPAYSMYFFGTRYAPLAQLLWPQPPDAGVGPLLSGLAPPSPGTV